LKDQLNKATLLPPAIPVGYLTIRLLLYDSGRTN